MKFGGRLGSKWFAAAQRWSIDASHNLASVAALVETLDESFSPARRTLVFAGTKEKDTRGMLSLLLPRFERVIFTRYLNNPRHVPAEELLALAQELGATHCRVAADPAAAWKAVVDGWETGDLICVTGSFFIAAEMQGRNRKELRE